MTCYMIFETITFLRIAIIPKSGNLYCLKTLEAHIFIKKSFSTTLSPMVSKLVSALI